MNSVYIKTSEELELMRAAAKDLTAVFAMLDEFIQPGVTTMQINDQAEDFIVNTLHARPASKGQYGFPYALNTSPNEVICHGMPAEWQHLKHGDIVNVDITLEKNGWMADSSKMYVIGDATPISKRLVQTTYEAMWQGIAQVKPGATLGDIGHAIQVHAESQGYSVVREYCGHGIGKDMHEEPQVLHYGRTGTGLVLKEGMTFTIEPMINQGSPKIKTKKDGWTVITRDKKLSAQWEHTILVTADGFEVLTLREEELPFYRDLMGTLQK